MKKLSMFTISSLLLSFHVMCYATVFGTPVKIGSYMTTRAGGPSLAYASGYTSKTENSFTFGEGDNALTLQFKNEYMGNGRGSSSTTGLFIGGRMVSTMLYSLPEIYRIESDDGIVAYIGKGTTGLEQNFVFIAKKGNPHYGPVTTGYLARYIPGIEFMDSPDAKRIGTPFAYRNLIGVPIGKPEDKDHIGFLWNSEAGKFELQINKKYMERYKKKG